MTACRLRNPRGSVAASTALDCFCAKGLRESPQRPGHQPTCEHVTKHFDGRDGLWPAIPLRVRPESGMREIRQSGSEGEGHGMTGSPYPYLVLLRVTERQRWS